MADIIPQDQGSAAVVICRCCKIENEYNEHKKMVDGWYKSDQYKMMVDECVVALKDNGGRRSGIERRQTSINQFIPEIRRGIDRRCAKDRRCSPNRREEWINGTKVLDLRTGIDRRKFFNKDLVSQLMFNLI
ncbi:MAG: hypothetical protein KKH68_10345 [Proteobacteria bacterium]|nr:hypothetical protein [Pseudomonadota bacterium]